MIFVLVLRVICISTRCSWIIIIIIIIIIIYYTTAPRRVQINTFSAGILATHSLLDFSVLGVGGRLSRSRNWLFLSIYTVRQFIRSLSLATLHLLSIEPVTFAKHEYILSIEDAYSRRRHRT